MTPVRWSDVTAIFGGVFDPPHVGHREAVRGLFSAPGVRQVLILPSASPAYKPCQASPEQRMEMARLNFSARPGDSFPAEVEFSDLEIERARRFPNSKTYTYDTLQELRSESSKLAFVIGADQLAKMPTWYRFPDVLEFAHWIVLARQPDGASVALDALREWESSGLARRVPGSADAVQGLWYLRSGKCCLKLVPTGAPAVSSTGIRESIARTGSPPAGTLVPEVSAYLKQNRLYGSTGPEDKDR